MKTKSRIQSVCLSLLFLAGTVAVHAAQFGDFTYESGGTEITITGYTCPGGDVTIPDAIAGLPVTSIGHGAFRGCTSLTGVVIPNSVASVGDWAFSGCTSLTGAYFVRNAPSGDSSMFDGADNVTIYYLPGTTGWGPTYAGRPTALWANPLILEGTVGVKADALGFTIAWAPDATVVVEGATDVTAPTWVPVSTHVLTGGVAEFHDPEPAIEPVRFYRLRSP